MAKTLKDRIKADIMFAQFGLTHSDECMLDQAAYHVQRAVEKELKVLIQLSGATPRKTHDIMLLYSTALGVGVVFPGHLQQAIVTYGSFLTAIEAESRYASSYTTVRATIVASLELALALYSFVFPDRAESNTLKNLHF